MRGLGTRGPFSDLARGKSEVAQNSPSSLSLCCMLQEGPAARIYIFIFPVRLGWASNKGHRSSRSADRCASSSCGLGAGTAAGTAAAAPPTAANGGTSATCASFSCCLALLLACSSPDSSAHARSCRFMSSKDVNVTAAAGVVRSRLVRQPW